MTKPLWNHSLSADGFYLTPRYNSHAALPDRPEPEDRLFNPDLDTITMRPQKIGEIYDRQTFSGHGYDVMNVSLGIKEAQSDTYYIPRELAPFREAIQTIIDKEHNTTPLAFTQIAQIAVRHCTPGTVKWHFDGGNTEQGTRTYNVADIDPTEFMDVPLFLSAHERCELENEHPYKQLLQAARNGLECLSMERSDIYHLQPYEISRHFMSTYHRAGADEARTLVSVFYRAQTGSEFMTFNPMIPVFNRVSLPLDQAAHALRAYRSVQKQSYG